MSACRAQRRPLSKAAWWAEDTDVDVGLARTRADFDAAFRLVHDQYVHRGFVPPEASGRRVGVHALLSSTKVLVATIDGRVVGTMTVIEDSRLGLPMDMAFAVELGRLRGRGRRLAESGALAVEEAGRRQSAAILIRLYRMAMLYVAAIARLDDLCFVVHPRHEAFYRSLFPFEQFRERRLYAPMKGVPPAAGFRLDLGLARAVVRAERWDLSAGPLCRFLFGPTAYRDVMRRLRRDLAASVLTPTEWAGLFADAARPAPNPSERRFKAVVGAVHSEPGGDA
jgi:hypothetical protein